MINGGYIMIDFSGLSLSNTGSQEIPGLFFSLDTAIKTKKPIIGYNLIYNDNIIFCRNINIAKNDNSIVCTTDTLTITVTADDAAIVSEATSGTSDYEDLENLPKINSVEIKGNVSLATLGAATTEDIAELQPVDSVTDGEHKAVSSNAVYDYFNESVSVINQGSETVKSMLTRLWALIDFSKMTNTSTIIRGREVYHVITKGTSSGKDAMFSRTAIGATSAIIEKIFIDETNSEFSENTITSGNLSHTDKSSSTVFGGFTLYYR